MSESLSLGFDLGGTQLRAALLRGNDVLKRVSAATDVTGGPDAVMKQFQMLAAQSAQGADLSLVKAIGVSAPGPLDTVTGIVDHIPTLPGWDGFPLRQRLSEIFSKSVAVENDAIAAAYGEWKHGAGRGLNNLVYVTVSTGVGGGAIVDGRLLHGRRGMAAHVGHIRLAPEGPRCACGGIGCFEAFAAGTALSQRARESAVRNPAGYLGKIAADGRAEARHVMEGARLKDQDCVALLADEARYLGIGFTAILHIFSPERIIMGGGVSQGFDLLSEDIHAVIRRDALLPHKDTRVLPAELGDNAGLIGAAALARDPSQQAGRS
jgi:glucokinase